MYKGFSRLIDELFERDANIKGTKGHTLRLKKKQSDTFSRRMVNRWNSLDQEQYVGSINSFKGRLDEIRKANQNQEHRQKWHCHM